MKNFVARLGSRVTGVLSGFDRLVFPGSLPMLHARLGMFTFLSRAGIQIVGLQAER